MSAGIEVEPAALLRSRLVVLAGLAAELALIMPATFTDLRAWVALALGTALSYPLLRFGLRHLPPRRLAIRALVVLGTAGVIGLSGALVFAIAGGVVGVDGVVLVTSVVAILSLAPAALGYVALHPTLPEPGRDPELRRLERPSLAAALGLLLAWLLISGLGAWLLTGLFGDTSCNHDGACSFGLPLRFASFGRRDGGTSMDWGVLVQDFALFASLFPAAYASARLRPRWPFVLHLVVIGGWIAWVAADSWGGGSSFGMWLGLDLRSL